MSFPLKRISSATYVKEQSGISFKRILLFVTTVQVSTDKLLVSEEGVRVLDKRE